MVWCKHYDNLDRGTPLDAFCTKLGRPVYDMVEGPQLGRGLRKPCNRTCHGSSVAHPDHKIQTCEHFEAEPFWEVAFRQVDMDRAVARTVASIPWVAKIQRRHKGQNAKGKDECPICGADVWYTHSALNGHVWAKCDTDDCLCFAM